jgi:hypothetical protein
VKSLSAESVLVCLASPSFTSHIRARSHAHHLQSIHTDPLQI